MHIKDYYRILDIETSATSAEIKKAFRRLAQQYHPDKNNNDPFTAALFADIKEAYEVLTDPAKKDSYLQKRWYNQSIGKRKKHDVITPVTVLKQSLELDRYVATLDVFRMDKHGLKEYILSLLDDDTIGRLKAFTESETNREIIMAIIKAMQPLPKKYTGEIITQLQKLAGTDAPSLQQINSFVEKSASRHRHEKSLLAIIMMVTALLCLIIYLTGR
jgi:curved DNA-binding protein CbpA